jgi:hypothetical protein
MNTIFNLDDVSEQAGNFVAGFVDGEGSFFTSTRQHCTITNGNIVYERPTGWRFSVNFNISNNDITVLKYCQKQLGCGNITKKKDEKYALEIQDKELFKKHIVPFFKKFQFVAKKKRHEFRVFQVLLRLLDQKQIRTLDNLRYFLKLRKNLGQYREPRISHSDEIILSTFRPAPILRVNRKKN